MAINANSPWTDILSADQIAALYALTATLDARFAASEREFWESRTAAELRSLKAGAWDANDSTTYQMARSYLAVLA